MSTPIDHSNVNNTTHSKKELSFGDPLVVEDAPKQSLTEEEKNSVAEKLGDLNKGIVKRNVEITDDKSYLDVLSIASKLATFNPIPPLSKRQHIEGYTKENFETTKDQAIYKTIDLLPHTDPRKVALETWRTAATQIPYCYQSWATTVELLEKTDPLATTINKNNQHIIYKQITYVLTGYEGSFIPMFKKLQETLIDQPTPKHPMIKLIDKFCHTIAKILASGGRDQAKRFLKIARNEFINDIFNKRVSSQEALITFEKNLANIPSKNVKQQDAKKLNFILGVRKAIQIASTQ